ncbi:MAG: hypothetical protein E6Q42_11175 [Dechloromonas sp.]|nr:MAG: hypothetical protein E6Q42_11175 [Dechloromonas sp.]
MRKSGTLQTWNEERGFGFVSPSDGGQALFVHISEFPKDGSRPTVGEKLTYVETPGRDNRLQATKVERTAFSGGRASRPKLNKEKSSFGRWMGALLVLALIAAGAKYGYQKYEQYSHRQQLERMPVSSAPVPAPAVRSGVQFVCDGRTMCSQMTSCAEATWFINNCPGTKMDGNHDGIPCEQQWCK